MMQTHYFLKIPLETILSVASLAISIGGFISIFIKDEKKKKIALITVLSTLLILSAISYIRLQQHEYRVTRVSNEIIEKLGVESKTFDQLYEQLFFPDFSVLSKALDNLIREGRVGHKILEVRDDRGDFYRVRVFYLRSK